MPKNQTQANSGEAVPADKAKRKRALPDDATPQQKFEHYAATRAVAAVKKIESIGDLTTDTYAYAPEHVERLKSVLTAAVAKMGDRLMDALAKPAEKSAPDIKIF